MEPSIQEQMIQFSNKHFPKHLIRYLKYPFVLNILAKLLCIPEIIELEAKLRDLKNFELVDALVKHSGITCNIENLEKIPAEGRLLIAANHPLGGADWLLIVQFLRTIRSDIKVVINKDVHTLIVHLRDLFIPVSSYAKFNEQARKQIGECLEKEEAVIIFPAGGISVMTLKGVADRKWKNGVTYFSRDHHADILPVFIGGRFHLAYYFCPDRLRRFLVIRNLLHPAFKKINITIGGPISHKEILECSDISGFTSRLRSVTYQLGKK
jgi:putative hemolysin